MTEKERKEIISWAKEVSEKADFILRKLGATNVGCEESDFKKVSNFLKYMGIPANLKGYSYAREAILYYHNHPNCLVMEAYKKVAEKYDCTWTRVERGIRHAIEVSCERVPIENYYEIFGMSISSIKGKPTNAEFFAQAVEHLWNIPQQDSLNKEP